MLQPLVPAQVDRPSLRPPHRQLEEALTHGLDPLHLAEVFGLDDKTAMRYADSARALLEQAAEQQLL
ncbi:hypothetical protein ABR737_07860 [Streptomyces sp. Edi2]|uniref:hypothetical protein n=1 Tax=Streptomyces sp. Edi2 TaxID=3162528 RepID=UPI003305CF70